MNRVDINNICKYGVISNMEKGQYSFISVKRDVIKHVVVISIVFKQSDVICAKLIPHK